MIWKKMVLDVGVQIAGLSRQLQPHKREDFETAKSSAEIEGEKKRLESKIIRVRSGRYLLRTRPRKKRS